MVFCLHDFRPRKRKLMNDNVFSPFAFLCDQDAMFAFQKVVATFTRVESIRMRL